MKIISKILSVLLFVAVLSSCNNDDDNTAPQPQELNIVETASANSDLSSLVSALGAADGDLVSVLSGAGPFTVLAPTNDAFNTFLSQNGYASLGEVPTDMLSQILLNHVISGEVTASDLSNMGSGYTNTNATGAAGRNLSIFFDAVGGVRFNGVATVTSADVMASNGVVHVIDAVIGLPNLVDHATANPSLSDLVSALTDGGDDTFTTLLSTPGDFTVFAPDNTAFGAYTNPNGNDLADVLSNHVIVGTTAVSDGLTTGYVNTAATYGDTMDEYLSMYINTDNGVTLNGTYNVTTADVVATNGVIHVVDGVIDIPTVVTFATADPDFSSLAAALTTSGQPDFVGTLSAATGEGEDPFTVFAPTNDAFQALLDSNEMWNGLDDIDSDLLTSVLEHHVITSSNVRSGDLTDGIAPATLEGDVITINLPGNDGNPAQITDGSGNTGIDIIAVDVQAGNGVIHVIETVLIPDTMN